MTESWCRIYTFDGIHVKPAYMEWWQEYLLQHGVK